MEKELFLVLLYPYHNHIHHSISIKMKRAVLFFLASIFCCQLFSQNRQSAVKKLKVTILSTMYTQGRGIGEWGFSALIEADTVKILFDAGARNQTVMDNCKELGIDLSVVRSMVLSHNHGDHTTGWIPLRKEFQMNNANALSVTHVGSGIFDSRISSKGEEETQLKNDSLKYVQSGGKIILHQNFEEIYPGIFLTGQVPRKYPEKNYGTNGKKKDGSGKIVEDIIPEDMSLVIQTEKGLVLISGCGHAGIINTIEHIESNMQHQPVLAAIGGFHLLNNSDEQIRWTADELKKTGIRYFMGAHCTGIEPVYQLREWVGLKRGECIVGSVGAVFETGKGFTAGALTR